MTTTTKIYDKNNGNEFLNKIKFIEIHIYKATLR